MLDMVGKTFCLRNSFIPHHILEIILVLLIFCMVPVTGMAVDEWDREDIQWEAAFVIIRSLDWLQARDLAKNTPRYWEVNPILGNILYWENILLCLL